MIVHIHWAVPQPWLYNWILIASERLFQLTRLYLCIVILYISALFNPNHQTLAYHGKTCTTTVPCKQPVIHTRVSVCTTNYLGSIQECCSYLISAMVLPRYQLIQWLHLSWRVVLHSFKAPRKIITITCLLRVTGNKIKHVYKSNTMEHRIFKICKSLSCYINP